MPRLSVELIQTLSTPSRRTAVVDHLTAYDVQLSGAVVDPSVRTSEFHSTLSQRITWFHGQFPFVEERSLPFGAMPSTSM